MRATDILIFSMNMDLQYLTINDTRNKCSYICWIAAAYLCHLFLPCSRGWKVCISYVKSFWHVWIHSRHAICFTQHKQQSDKEERKDTNSSWSFSKPVLTIFLLHLVLILTYLSNLKSITFHKLRSCGDTAFRSIQSGCPRLVTYPGTLSHDNVMSGFHSSSRTLNLQKQLQKLGKAPQLLLLLPKASDSSMPTYRCKEGCYGREREQENKFRGFCLGSGIHSYWSVYWSADLWATLPPTASDIRSARAAERSMEQLREPAGRGKEQWIVRDKEIKRKRKKICWIKQ